LDGDKEKLPPNCQFKVFFKAMLVVGAEMPPDRGAGVFSASEAGWGIFLAVYIIIFSLLYFVPHHPGSKINQLAQIAYS
jgi:hypothetical protein